MYVRWAKSNTPVSCLEKEEKVKKYLPLSWAYVIRCEVPSLPHYRFCLNSNKLPLSEKTKYGRFVMVLLGTGERSTHARVWTQQSFHFNFIFLFPHEWVYESNFIIASFFSEKNIKCLKEVRAWVWIEIWVQIRSFLEILRRN